MKRLLIVAGSDSGGGAGIQADIKTATMHGVFAMTAVTAITVQDTRGVHGVHVIPDEAIADQMAACLIDIGADAVKTGMLASAGTIETVARVLERHAPDVPLVVDPVMVAKGGARLIDETAVAAMKTHLFPRAAVITPNLPEAAALLEMDEIADVVGMEAAGQGLLAFGPRAVLMKGGHLPGGQVTDLLITRAGMSRFDGPRIESRSTHGTGCTLASAIASGLAQGLALSDAVAAGRVYVTRAIETAPGLGHGHGPLNHMHGLTS
ncbi:MAG: bifunctional hydroxymethylpyrimidine kinase/phosphomethylpyrimidine kinase [Micropepsaceae bacterium]